MIHDFAQCETQAEPGLCQKSEHQREVLKEDVDAGMCGPLGDNP